MTSLAGARMVGGSFARTGLPGTVASATYDAANELTNWNGTTIGYDLNGNMLSDGTNTFTWNARDQVATLNGAGLQYDAFGRRTQNLLGTSFLYDGANAAQELSGTTVTANMLTGGIDEFFNRTDSSGSFTPLKDALGSTIALVDGSGVVTTSYSYDPFGNTTVSGAVSSNPSQYTGRENEGNGLYYYRARYYSPLLGRFISEDPLGFAGSGSNFYAYVFNDPIDLIDPLGLWTVSIGGTINVSFGFINFQYSGGFVVDGHGDIGVYNTYTPLPTSSFGYGGVGNLGNLAPSHLHPFSPPAGSTPVPRVNGSIGLSLAGSNAQYICDLGGPFLSGSAGAGAGVDASVDGFAGPSDHGVVVGGGVTVGAGAGEGGSLGITNTNITPLAGRYSRVGCH